MPSNECNRAPARGLRPPDRASRLRAHVRGRAHADGRCEARQGDGLIEIKMNFLPDVYIECEECKGSRYNRETLEVRYKAAPSQSAGHDSGGGPRALQEHTGDQEKAQHSPGSGLGYIKLGQSSTTLSGGEAQRIKLTRELAKRGTGRTIYLLDEPTTGLHFDDVKKLIAVLNDLVDKGNTVVVIEHNLDVFKSADWIIDLGPAGGNEGGWIVAEGTPEEVARVEWRGATWGGI